MQKFSHIIFLMLIVFSLVFVSGCSAPTTDTPSPTPSPTPFNQVPTVKSVGDVWFEAPIQQRSNSDPFTSNIRVNTGTQKLAAYTFKISYDSTKLAIDTTTDPSGVTAGTQGFVTIVNSTVPGKITISSFDVTGKPASTDLDLLNIHWKVLLVKETVIKFDIVESLSDETTAKIGTQPKGYDQKIKFGQ